MSPHHGIPMLDTVMLAGVSAPAALAVDAISPSGRVQSATVAHSRSGGSPHWALIGAGEVVGIALVGPGVATARRRAANTPRPAGATS